MIELVRGDRHRRGDPQDVALRAVDHQALIEAAVNHIGGGFKPSVVGRRVEFDADEQAAAADVFYDGVGLSERAQPSHGRVAEEGGVFDKAVALEDVEDASGDGHGQTVAAEGRGVFNAALCLGVVEFGDAWLGAHDADREPAANAFAQRHDVGLDAPVLVRKVFSGPPAAGPDFIADEQEVMLITEGAELLEVVGVGHVDAAFALDRLGDNRDGFVIERGLDGRKIVVRDVGVAGQVRGEAFADGGVRGGAHGGERSAVERLGAGDGFVAAELAGAFAGVGFAVEPGEFERGFVGVGAAVTEERSAAETELANGLGGAGLRLGVEEVADVPQFFGLFGHGVNEVGVAMAQHRRAESREEVEVAFAVGVAERAAVTLGDGDGVAAVIDRHERVVAIDDSGGGIGGGGGRGHGKGFLRTGVVVYVKAKVI